MIVYKIVELGHILKQVPLSGKRAKDPLQDRQDIAETHIIQGAWQAEQVRVLLLAYVPAGQEV